MKKYYISLAQNLCGYYVLAMAEKEKDVRQWANKTLGRMWCSIYTQEELEKSGYFDMSKVIGKLVTLTVEDGELYENYLN
jgi:hypothetical protein